MAVKWEEVLAFADRQAPELVRAFLAYVAAVRDVASARKVAEALRRGDVTRAIESIPWASVAADSLQPQAAKILRDIVERAGELAVLPGKVEVAFDIVNPRTFEFIRTETARLVTNVTEETKAAIRAIVEDAFRIAPGKLGQGPRAMAEDIVAHIGPNERQMRALLAYREKLVADGAPNVETLVDRYHARLVKERALLIGRTEALMAANAGQRLKWDQAIADGLLDPARWEASWIVSPDERLCPKCKTMQGNRRSVTGRYTEGVYAGTVGPPGHPRCRCTEVLKRKAQTATIRRAA